MALLDAMLQRAIKRGELTVIYADGRQRTFGSPDPAFKSVVLRFPDKATPGKIARWPRFAGVRAEDYEDCLPNILVVRNLAQRAIRCGECGKRPAHTEKSFGRV